MPNPLEKCLSILNRQEGEHSWSGESGQANPNVFVCGRCGYRLYGEKILEELVKIKQRHQNSYPRINPLARIEAPLQTRIDELEQELRIERTTAQEALRTGQEWHERQKAEVIAEWKQKLTTYRNQRKTSLQAEITLIKEVLRE